MNAKDKKIIEAYLKLKISAVYADIQLIQLKKAFYKACAKNSIRVDKDSNRIVDLKPTSFANKVQVREAFTARKWNYNPSIRTLMNQLSVLKKTFESSYEPAIKGKRIWVVDVYNTMMAHSIFTNKVIHKGKVYDKENIKRRKTEAVA